MARKYTDEMLSFIREHSSTTTRQELTEMFNERFNMNITADSMQWICKSNKIKGKPSFVKGVCPYKNVKYEIGDEFFMAGEWRVLTSLGDGNRTILQRSEYKKRIIWEKAYGEIPPKHCFIYLDGDKRNCELDNLACIPILWMRILNQNGWLKGNREITLSALKWCELHYNLSTKMGNRYVKSDGKRYR